VTDSTAPAPLKPFPAPLVAISKSINWFNRLIGRFAMYLFLVLAAILLYSTFSRLITGIPVNWALEMCQFILSAYYILGGAWAMQTDSHVRMDLIYGRLKPMRRAQVDAITILFVIFYLVVMIRGGWSSTEYAIVYQQKNYSAWSPVLWPVKVVITFGIFLVLLQAVSALIRDIAQAMGRPFE
jgi:TRAP-type mannitol/chloroaromatic compound transport system permease small subunit